MKTLRIALLSLLCVALAPLTSSLLGSAADSVGLTSLATALDDAGSAHAAFIRRGKIKQRATIGYKVVVIVGDDVGSDEVTTVEVALSAQGEGGPSDITVFAPLKRVTANGNKRFVFNQLDGSDFNAGDSFLMTSTMKDATNQVVGEPLSRVVTVEDAGDPAVRSVTIQQLDASNFELRALIVSDFASAVSQVEVGIQTEGGPPAIPESLVLIDPARNGGKAIFSESTLTFEDPAGAADEVYSLLVDMRDSTGASLGAYEAEIVVMGLAAEPDPNAERQAAIDLLDELGASVLADAAAAHGVVLAPGAPDHHVSPEGAVLWSAATEDGGTLTAGDGFGSVTIDNTPVQLVGLVSVYMVSTAQDDGSVFHDVQLRNGDGSDSSWGIDDVRVYVLGLEPGGNGVGGSTPTGIDTYGPAKYGDIIIGPAAHWSDLTD